MVPYIDLGPILLTDHYHKEYYDIIKDVMSTDINSAVSPPSFKVSES